VPCGRLLWDAKRFVFFETHRVEKVCLRRAAFIIILAARCRLAGGLARLTGLAASLAETARMARYLHTSIFVSDMAASIDFYTNKLGLRLLDGPLHYPGNADMAFVGADWNAYIELVYDLEDHPPYQLGNRYEHLALEIDGDFKAEVARLEAAGVKVLTQPKKSPGGSRWLAFVEDPNGIPVELLEARSGNIT
jgi:lactoylglutathione lyase